MDDKGKEKSELTPEEKFEDFLAQVKKFLTDRGIKTPPPEKQGYYSEEGPDLIIPDKKKIGVIHFYRGYPNAEDMAKSMGLSIEIYPFSGPREEVININLDGIKSLEYQKGAFLAPPTEKMWWIEASRQVVPKTFGEYNDKEVFSKAQSILDSLANAIVQDRSVTERMLGSKSSTAKSPRNIKLN